MARKAKPKEIKFKSDLNVDEYYKLTRYFPKYKKKLRIQLAIKYLIFTIIFSLCFCYINLVFGIGLLIFLVISFTIAITLDFEHGAKKSIQSYIKKNKYTSVYENTIKENIISRKNGDIVFNHDFENIEEVIISDNDIFMYDKKFKIYMVFQKKHMNYNIIEFIKSNFDNVKIIKDKDLEKIEELSDKKKKKINIIMIILLLLNIITPFAAGSVANAVISSQDIITLSSKIKCMYIFWLFLPLPVLSIILGFYYKKRDLNTFKNILIGFIILIYLLIVGSTALLPTYEVDYKEIDKYKEIISVELPKKGELEYKKLKSDDKNVSNYSVYTIYFNEKGATKVLNEIRRDDAWFSASKLKTNLKIFTNIDKDYFDASYYSIYNKTSDEYNVLPIKDGKYEIYVMKYYEEKGIITMEMYTYNYKNQE